jgi:hypothetical protein
VCAVFSVCCVVGHLCDVLCAWCLVCGVLYKLYWLRGVVCGMRGVGCFECGALLGVWCWMRGVCCRLWCVWFLVCVAVCGVCGAYGCGVCSAGCGVLTLVCWVLGDV